MKKEAPVRLAIVGCNVSAALMAYELASSDRLRVSWHQTDKDRENSKHSDPEWLLLPHDYQSALGLEDWALPLKDIFYFSEGDRRCSLEDLNSGKAAGTWRHVHPAIRRKCFSMGLWNDLTPKMWRSNLRGAHEPNSSWPNQLPLSALSHSRFKPYLVPRALFLKRMHEVLKEKGVEVLHGDRCVLGLQFGSSRGGHRIVHNAPFEYSEVDRILWTSTVAGIREESASRRRSLKPVAGRVQGCWQSFGAYVEDSRVAALPLFSIWLDPSSADLFLDTGLLGSGNLKRVYCIPDSLHEGPRGHSWVQIQRLLIFDSESSSSLEPTGSAERMDAFLWKLCPYLETSPLEWHELTRRDEDQFFGDPRPLWHRFRKGAYFWSPGTTERLPQAAKHLLTQL